METKKAKQFFIRFESSSGSLAVEKHLHSYVRQHFADHLVDEDAIERIVKDIESEQERYFQTHRGQKVEISVYNNGCTDGKFIHIGQMCAVLILVKGHYVSNPCKSNENLQGSASSWHKTSEELPKAPIWVHRKDMKNPILLDYSPVLDRWLYGEYGYNEKGVREHFKHFIQIPEIPELPKED